MSSARRYHLPSACNPLEVKHVRTSARPASERPNVQRPTSNVKRSNVPTSQRPNVLISSFLLHINNSEVGGVMIGRELRSTLTNDSFALKSQADVPETTQVWKEHVRSNLRALEQHDDQEKRLGV